MDRMPVRAGPRPATSRTLPHQQLDQQPPNDQLRNALAGRVFALAGVSEEPSAVSVPGARALVLDAALAAGARDAFLVGREFAHLHPGADHSLHMVLPESIATAACDAGWAEPHPLATSGRVPKTLVMVFAPRDDQELGVVAGLVETSYRYASSSGAKADRS
ncbi:MAG: DUF5519 family protein [Candidatus Dormibacteraeota bacterium]|nr:DUF5519 family protein [Candidatus Dormibacteraeota bacterium]